MTTDPATAGTHAAVLLATGGPRDLRTSVRIAADVGISDQAATGALRALGHKDLVQSTGPRYTGAGSYWSLTTHGEYVQGLLAAAVARAAGATS